MKGAVSLRFAVLMGEPEVGLVLCSGTTFCISGTGQSRCPPPSCMRYSGLVYGNHGLLGGGW